MLRDTRKAVHVGLLGGVLLLASTSALACDREYSVCRTTDTYSMKVKFDDLDLSRKAGAQTLYDRLRSAARRVCAADHSSALIPLIRSENRCFAESLQRAVEDIDNQILTALHEQRTGPSDSGDAVAAIYR